MFNWYHHYTTGGEMTTTSASVASQDVLTLRTQYENGYNSERRYVMPGPFRDTNEIVDAAQRRGSHFFDRATMRSFNSRITPGVIAGRIFITSEQDKPWGAIPGAWNGQRRYTVRVVDDHAQSVEEIGTFGQFDTLASARTAVNRVLKGQPFEVTP
jgi:hypothetical protein